jgi:hypothetical protein
MSGFSIICDARHGEAYAVEVLALVDRTKEKEIWWTSDDPTIILKYNSYRTVQQTIRRLKFNNPRIVTYEEAVSIIQKQQQRILEQVLKNITHTDNGFTDE